jgi:4-amino-4-deoxy-L-arabinose transferase-like glycosyltransferase
MSPMPVKRRANLSPRLRSWLLTLAILLIIGLAAFLRFGNLASSSFTYDAAAVSNLAVQFIATGVPPLHGMVSSVGLNNPPLGIYLFSLPMLFDRSPIALQGFVALLNTLAVLGCFYLGYRYWNAAVGLAAALLFAVSPWAVHHGRRILGQDLLGAGVVLFFIFLYAWFVGGRRWSLAWACVTLAALTQIHFAAFAFAPLMALLLLIEIVRGARRCELRQLIVPLFLGLALSLVLYLPYLADEARGGWAGVRALREAGSPAAQWRPEAVGHVLLNIGGRNIHSLAGAQRFREYLQSIPDLHYWPDRIEELLAALAVVYLAARLWARRRDAQALRRDGLLLLWIVTPVLVFLRWRSEVPPHYLAQVFPAPYLALAAAGSDLLAVIARRTRRPSLVTALGVTSMAALAVLAAWQSYLSISIYHFVDRHNAPGGWGTPVRILLEAADAVERYAEAPNHRPVLILCPGSEPRWDECPAVFRYLTAGLPDVSFMDYNDPLIWSRQEDVDTLVLLAHGDSLARAELPNMATLLPGESIPLREGVDEYAVYRIHDDFSDAAAVLEGAASRDDAILLTAAAGGDRFRSAYRGGAPIYELPAHGSDTAQTIARLEEVARRHGQIFTVSFKPEERDPEGSVTGWLRAHTLKADEAWMGGLQLASYITPVTAASWPSQTVRAGFGETLTLEKAALPGREFAAGGLLPVRLAFTAQQMMDTDLALSLQLLDRSGRVVAQRDAPLFSGSRPAAGEQVVAAPGITIPVGTAPGEYNLALVLYDPQTGARLPVNGRDSLALSAVQVNRPEASPETPVGIPYPQAHAFGELTLLGLDRRIEPADALDLTLWWRAESRPIADWAYQVRLLDGAGRMAAEAGGQLHPDHPATAWEAGEIVRSRQQLPLSATPEPGRYRLQLALVNPTGGQASAWTDLGPVVVK